MGQNNCRGGFLRAATHSAADKLNAQNAAQPEQRENLSSSCWSLWRCCPGDCCWDVTQHFAPLTVHLTPPLQRGPISWRTHPPERAGSRKLDHFVAKCLIQQLQRVQHWGFIIMNRSLTTFSFSAVLFKSCKTVSLTTATWMQFTGIINVFNVNTAKTRMIILCFLGFYQQIQR